MPHRRPFPGRNCCGMKSTLKGRRSGPASSSPLAPLLSPAGSGQSCWVPCPRAGLDWAWVPHLDPWWGPPGVWSSLWSLESPGLLGSGALLITEAAFLALSACGCLLGRSEPGATSDFKKNLWEEPTGCWLAVARPQQEPRSLAQNKAQPQGPCSELPGP